MPTKTLFTCIFGKDIDDLKPLRITTASWRYVCITDQNLGPVEGWEIIKVPTMDCGPIKTARYYKINYSEIIDSEISLFVDGTFAVNVELDRWEMRKWVAPFTVIKHPVDDCVFVEAASCVRIGRGIPMEIMQQATDYLRDGMPQNFGLISSGILMRERNQKVIDFCKRWWEQVEKYSSRDQISFSYVKWKEKADWIYTTVWDYRTQREFFHIPHLYKQHKRQERLFELELIKPIIR